MKQGEKHRDGSEDLARDPEKAAGLQRSESSGSTEHDRKRKLLDYLACEYCEDRGCIVDAGCFLGGSVIHREAVSSRVRR